MHDAKGVSANTALHKPAHASSKELSVMFRCMEETLQVSVAKAPYYSAGSVKVGSYSLRGLAVRDIIVTSPEHLGSHVVFKAKSVTLHPSWSIFKGRPYGLHTRMTCLHANCPGL